MSRFFPWAGLLLIRFSSGWLVDWLVVRNLGWLDSGKRYGLHLAEGGSWVGSGVNLGPNGLRLGYGWAGIGLTGLPRTTKTRRKSSRDRSLEHSQVAAKPQWHFLSSKPTPNPRRFPQGSLLGPPRCLLPQLFWLGGKPPTKIDVLKEETVP